jgi:hypothetical protein
MAGAARHYVIEKRGSQWCLLTQDKSRVLGCHPSEAAAAAQEAAITKAQAARNHSALHDIKNAEIFRTGKWNGDTYDESDLDSMIVAASQVGFGVPIKQGHKDVSGEPALGWVENLRREGGVLLADLVGLPEKIFEAIKDRAFDAVSAEIFWDLERNGASYPRVLKALALLGAEVPAVDLKPLRALFSADAYPMPPHLQALSYVTDLKISQVSAGPNSHADNMGDGAEKAQHTEPDEDDKGEKGTKPDSDGTCPAGKVKGRDGLCYDADTTSVPAKNSARARQHDENSPAALSPPVAATGASQFPPPNPDIVQPYPDGLCPPGYDKGNDGKCYRINGESRSTQTVPQALARTKSVQLSREIVEELCPGCADQMVKAKITKLKIPQRPDGTWDFSVLKNFTGFSQGLCDKWGESEGFRTRCMDGMQGDVDDVGAFCNALKEWCGLSLSNSEKSGSVHTHRSNGANHMADHVDLNEGQIIVTMAEIDHLRRRAEKADRLEPLEKKLQDEKLKNDEIEERRRVDRIAYKMRDVRLPAFRPYIKTLYEIASTTAPGLKIYSVASREQLDAEGVVELLVEELNKQANYLFQTLSVGNGNKRNPDEPDELQDKIQFRVQAYCRANKLDAVKDYKVALQAVLAADPDLKLEYART